MDGSSLFVSTCSRREMARRRAAGRSWRGRYLRRRGSGGRWRTAGAPRSGLARPGLATFLVPALWTAVILGTGLGAYLAGRGGL